MNVCLPISMNLDILDIQNQFYEKYPQCKLNITCVKSAVAYEAVQARECSFAVGPEPPEKTQLRFDSYLKNILFLVVLQAETTNTRRRIDKLADKYNLELVPVLAVESTSIAIMSARQQVGYCFLGQSYRSQVQENDPLKLYVLRAGSEQIEHSERGIISLPGKSFSPQERFVYRLVAENLAKDRLI